MSNSSSNEQTNPPQHQNRQPGIESQMHPQPNSKTELISLQVNYSKKVALITGGDSGIGRAVAVAYAKEGADIAIVYLNENKDAEETKQQVEQEGRRCLLISGDIGEETFCKQAVEQTVQELGGLHILVNNAAEQHPQKKLGRHQRRTAGADVPHQYFRNVPLDQSRPAPPEKKAAHHKYRVDHSLQRQSDASRLLLH